jgi:CBS domain-containing membrane protein
MLAPSTPVSQVMKRDFASLEAGERLDLAETLMKLGHVRHIPVLENGRLAGIVSHRDLLAASLTKVLHFDSEERRSFLHSVEVREVMSTEIVTIAADAPLSEAADLMLRYKIGCVPVVDGDGVTLGIVTESDLLRAAYAGAEREGQEDR